MKVSDHFNIEEFECPCCGDAEMKQSFILMLEAARVSAGIVFDVSSGYRCGKNNAKVGGKKGSAHTLGHAADIRCSNSADREKILVGLRDAGFRRIGISGTFIHADNDPTKPQGGTWLY